MCMLSGFVYSMFTVVGAMVISIMYTPSLSPANILIFHHYKCTSNTCSPTKAVLMIYSIVVAKGNV